MEAFHQALVEMKQVEDVLLDEVAYTIGQRRRRYQESGHKVN